jgi:hypothetical protein
VTVGAGHSAAGVEQEPTEPGPSGKKWRLALLGLVGVFVLLACYDLIAMGGHYGSNDAATASSKASASTKATQPAASHGSPSAPASPPTGKAAAPVPHSLGVTSVAAFGPEGLSDGDNPAIVSRILDVSTDQPWYSQWYASPEFGNLRSGTGLLLDMGETVTVSSIQLVLGAASGADVQVRVGDSPYPSDLPSVASAFSVGGTVQLRVPAPAPGRYVLIWFTRLPSNGQQGEYQVEVHSVTVDGTAR